MNRHLTPALLLLAGLATVMLMNAPAAQSDADAPDRILRHVVLFKFKEDATPAQIETVVREFGQLPAKIDEIHGYEWGVNNSPEDHAKGFTHCFLVTFKSEADRDAYLPHAAHQAFVKVLLPILDDVHVLDYWAQK